MKIIIWGAGEMGRRVVPYLKGNDIVAFIDNDVSKIGTQYMTLPVISLAEYEEKYRKIPILITPLAEEEIEDVLKSKGIRFYFRLSDCPYEFSNIEYTPVLENFSMNQIRKNVEFVIYGSTLFSIILNQWIKKNRGYYLTIILPSSTEHIIYENMQKANPEMTFSRETDFIMKDNINFLVTDEWYIEHLNKEGIDFKKIVNLYDISTKEKSYFNPDIEQYKGIHKGENCFIVGHGPSLQIRDLDILESNKMITFSMNSTDKCFDQTEWRPDYYVVDDRTMFDQQYYFEWEKYTKRQCFIADISEKFWKENQSKKNSKYHSVRNMNTRGAKFSEDISKRMYYGATVAYTCLQIAVYMGFKKIYLLGMDLAPYKQDKKSAVQYTHFYEEDYSDSKIKPLLWIDKILRGYLVAKEYADMKGIHIYNATRGGYLDIFDRVDFDNLFE